MMNSRLVSFLVALSAVLLAVSPAFADDSEFVLAIKDHRFQPAELNVPSGKKIKLKVHNQDSTPEEFESHTLKREKVIPGNSTATILIGPLKEGRYPFVGEFNEKTAQGVIVAK